MAPHPQILAGPGLATRLAAFYAAFFFVVGIQMPFFPLWLEAKGLDAGMIGLVLAVPAFVRVAALPIATRAADRRDALRGGIVLASGGAALGYGAVGLSDGAVSILVTYALASLALMPILPLADAYALKGLAAGGRSYGPVRLWGSAAFVAGSLAAGFMLDRVAAIDLIWFIVAASGASAVVAVALTPISAGALPREAPPSAARLLRDPAFLAVAAAASLTQASHAVYYGFSALHWRGHGYDGGTVGILWAIGVVAEIVLFAVSGRLPASIGPTVLLLAGAAGGCLRWLAMAFDPPAAALPILQCMHALSFGATHLGAIAFMGRAAPPGLAATAQGYLALAQGVAMAAAMGLSGLLYDAYGAGAYGGMAAAAGLGAAFALAAASRAGRR